MSAIVDKQVRMTAERASRLEQLAAERGTTEDALIEEGLDVLFREQERRAEREAALREGEELLRQMEAELGPIRPSSVPPISLEGATFIVGTPIAPERIRHLAFLTILERASTFTTQLNDLGQRRARSPTLP
jgi:hypothetical protein